MLRVKQPRVPVGFEEINLQEPRYLCSFLVLAVNIFHRKALAVLVCQSNSLDRSYNLMREVLQIALVFRHPQRQPLYLIRERD